MRPDAAYGQMPGHPGPSGMGPGMQGPPQNMGMAMNMPPNAPQVPVSVLIVE